MKLFILGLRLYRNIVLVVFTDIVTILSGFIIVGYALVKETVYRTLYGLIYMMCSFF